MGKKKVKRISRPIVESYLERIGQKVFSDFSSAITGLIKRHQGIYALYKRDKLYYIGLASNLKNRIKHHLNDKHKNCWTHFSLYIVSRQEHIKEFESVILRVAYPKGNSVKGKLVRARNLKPELKELLDAELEKQINGIIGGGVKSGKGGEKIKSVKKTGKSSGDRPLKGLFKTGKVIYATYKGKDYKAYVNRIGRLRYKGKWYDSPSAVGSVIRGGKSTNGWRFWKYKDKSGHLVLLTTLRK